MNLHEHRSLEPYLLKMAEGTYAHIVANCAISDDGGSFYADTSGHKHIVSP